MRLLGAAGEPDGTSDSGGKVTLAPKKLALAAKWRRQAAARVSSAVRTRMLYKMRKTAPPQASGSHAGKGIAPEGLVGEPKGGALVRCEVKTREDKRP